MSEQEVKQEVEISTNGGEPSAFSEPSLIDLIKQDVKELGDVTDVYIPIAGYEKSGLAVRYRLPENGKEIDRISTKVDRQFKDRFTRNLNTAVDTMIVLCLGLYVKPNGEGDTWYELDPELTGEPVRFDSRLAESLGWASEANGARDVVRLLFGGNDMAIMNHAEKLARWMNNTKADITKEVWQDMGE